MDLITIFLPLFLINCFKNFREILIVRSWRCMDGLGYLLLGTISPTHLWGEGGNQSATIRIFEGWISQPPSGSLRWRGRKSVSHHPDLWRGESVSHHPDLWEGGISQPPSRSLRGGGISQPPSGSLRKGNQSATIQIIEGEGISQPPSGSCPNYYIVSLEL